MLPFLLKIGGREGGREGEVYFGILKHTITCISFQSRGTMVRVTHFLLGEKDSSHRVVSQATTVIIQSCLALNI